jgi:hypothetical protein
MNVGLLYETLEPVCTPDRWIRTEIHSQPFDVIPANPIDHLLRCMPHESNQLVWSNSQGIRPGSKAMLHGVESLVGDITHLTISHLNIVILHTSENTNSYMGCHT